MKLNFYLMAGMAFALLSLTGMVLAQDAKTSVTMTPVSYEGWSNAYRLSNGIVDVVVVPQIGRIMSFAFTGQPDTNPLFNNPAWSGKPLPADTTVWANYGGDKLWPSEQGHWADHAPSAWPPDPALDNGPYTATPIPDGLRLTGPISTAFAGQFIRDIVLSPGKAEVVLHDTFLKSKDAQGAKNGFPIGIWSISQVVGDARVFVPLNLEGKFPTLGFTSFADTFAMEMNWDAHNGLLEVTRHPDKATKMGTDDSAGWMATLVHGDILFSHHFTRDSKATYPDKSSNAEVYTNPGTETPYIEVEVLGPMTNLRAGKRITRILTWHLQRLPRTPIDDADARALVTVAVEK